jgi:hypothetical protein
MSDNQKIKRSKSNVVQLRAPREPPNFQRALRWWRTFAHKRNMVVASPCRLIGAERTFVGDSDDVTFGPKDYKLISSDLLFDRDGVYMTKKERAELKEIADDLIEMGDSDIAECWTSPDSPLEQSDDEVARWHLMLDEKRCAGIVTRIGAGKDKRYILWLWNGGWYQMYGAPHYDLPMFGLPGLRLAEGKPVMIHEGPKSWKGAERAANLLAIDPETMMHSRLGNWMDVFNHVGWHGSDIGMEWTDWSPLRGKKVVVWPDMDNPGVQNARMLARKISQMGEVVEYVQWSDGDIKQNPRWDWGDEPCPFIANITRTQILDRIKTVESPFDAGGNILAEWCTRSFVDSVNGEVYQKSSGYQPIPLGSMNTEYGPNSARKIVNSVANPFVGRTFTPKFMYGRMPDGRINICPPSIRSHLVARPLSRELYEELRNGWLKNMIPDVKQRKHLLRRAAWAVARGDVRPDHMVILQGNSGIGKSVFLDLLVDVAGRDRAGAVFPDSIFKSFNDSIKDKVVACIHEIHSDDMTRKQNAGRMKELVGNSHITIREKYRNDETRENVIHWFGATNERVPFSLERGNDRFYFVRCAHPETIRGRNRMRKFFTKWVPIMQDPYFIDLLYAAAKHLVGTFTPQGIQVVTGRARRQKVWRDLEIASLRPWEQKLRMTLSDIEDQEADGKQPAVFYGMEVARYVNKEYKNVGIDDIVAKMKDFGYCTLRSAAGANYRRRHGKSDRRPVWCHQHDLQLLQSRYNFADLLIRGLYAETGPVDGGSS